MPRLKTGSNCAIRFSHSNNEHMQERAPVIGVHDIRHPENRITTYNIHPLLLSLPCPIVVTSRIERVENHLRVASHYLVQFRHERALFTFSDEPPERRRLFKRWILRRRNPDVVRQ